MPESCIFCALKGRVGKHVVGGSGVVWTRRCVKLRKSNLKPTLPGLPQTFPFG
ncbi:hypothetical protein M0804_001353 [Polistes exclamans]|nr:hypothetical protein M0804_001353 [Polistes exclamans]